MQVAWDNTIPHLQSLRRIPTRYRRILPLEVMKQYQCAIVGADEGVLTLAITNMCAISTIIVLSEMTESVIFPVLVDASRMRHLIKRLEYTDRYRHKRQKSALFLHPRQTQVLSTLLTSLNVEEG